MSKKIRVFINGFGRIGRSAARVILGRDDMELVGINDLYSVEQMVYLLKYDSVYGVAPQKIESKKNAIVVDEDLLRVYCESDPCRLRLIELEVDVLLQCSGMFLTISSNQPYLDAGANRVIVSTTAEDDMPTYIYGVNHQEYKGEPIISNTSCSANAIVPIFKIIDKHFGIRVAQMHMFHSYTAYQRLLDSKHYSKDIRRARAAAVNIIPLQSSAARATEQFFPNLKGKLYAKSIRIPVNACTMYDLLIKLDGDFQQEYIEAVLIDEIDASYSGILATTIEPKVSSDYIADPHSAIIDLPLMDLAGTNLLRISAWQDNEYGYACRLVDMLRVVTSNKKPIC
ncbi:MAG: type I glyceraldehyde-3-phosphate dehydrogenase [Sulfurovum sp.]|nr:type I glyceraldehyde-3-phosphate dehydrogenase [Sulfurovum sp.]